MANYVVNYTKKLHKLHDREECLRRLISHSAETKKLLDAAEEVRLARIRVLKARKAAIPPSYDPEEARIGNIDNKVEELQKTSAETILAEFQR
jgi:hypothetical protein